MSSETEVADHVSDIKHLKEWLEKEPHLPDSWGDSRLYDFLARCNFSLEKCKRRLEAKFTLKTALPEFFTGWDVLELKETLGDIQTVVIDDLLMPEGYSVMIQKYPKSSNFTLQNIIKLLLMVLDLGSIISKNVPNGGVYVANFDTELNSYFMKSFSITMLRKFLICLQESFPFKIKGLHFVNVSPVTQKILVLMKSFLKEKIRNRVHFHTDFDSLHKYIPQSYLPKEFGGNAGLIEELGGKWWKLLEEHQEWLHHEEEIKADESKRLGGTKNYDELFGTAGSFRQLKID